jgi:hypothetical protein
VVRLNLIPIDYTVVVLPSVSLYVLAYLLSIHARFSILIFMEPENGRRQVPKAIRIERARAGARARNKALTKARRKELATRAAEARHRRSTKAERQQAARKAVQARWAKARQHGDSY